MEIIEIKYITRDEASKIIETSEPRGLFYEVDGDVYVGIDNSDGDAWVEEFKTPEECLNWLRGNTEGTSEEKEEYLTELERKQSQLMEHYGKDRQLEKLVEECAELIKAIMKTKTNKVSYIDDDVLHEMADVKNLIQQFELKQNRLKDTVDLIIMCKVNRQLERIEKGEQ
ncbi:MAG: hypothetical protein ACOCG5_02475 [Candidatus Alkaliphilus sp. MAG34]